LGGCGGIFSPNLFLGSMCGWLVAGIASHFLSLNQSDLLLLAIGGMSACLGAVVQAPVTAVLIIFEMTHQFAVVPGLMLAALVSHVIARMLVAHNFYDAVLIQDGHRMEHVIPPRDLRSWHNLPISAIANFNPVFLDDMSASALRRSLDQHPYRYFPMIENGRLQGMASRPEIEAALAEHRPIGLQPARECRPADSIRASQTSLMESATSTLLLTDHPGGNVLAIVTLHDVLRAQISMGER
jgi:CIC family chloride channel protein